MMLVEDQQAPIGAGSGHRAPQAGHASAPFRGRCAGSRQDRPRRLLSVVTIVVTLLFSYLALSNLNLGLAWHAIRTSDYWWIAAALFPFALGNVARALRWRSLFARGRRPGVGVVLDATMVGYLYNSILPARAGEAARVVVLTQRSSTSPVEIVGTVVVERLYDVLAILLIFFAAEPWLPDVSWFGAAAVAAIVLAALIADARRSCSPSTAIGRCACFSAHCGGTRGSPASASSGRRPSSRMV